MRILITGATGQIGRWLLHTLAPNPRLELVLALRRPQPQLDSLRAWLAARHMQSAATLRALPFDLDHPDRAARLVKEAQPDMLVHLAARFAWGLSPQQAWRANGLTSLALLRALNHQAPQARFLHVSGFMLQHRAHLARLGLDETGQTKDWPAVYRRAGGYEASKLQAHVEMRALAAALAHPLLVLHPATVAGHSVEGELPDHAALYQLCRQLLKGRLGALPGTPAHRLPLVAVDHVARFIAALVQDPQQRGGDYLLMDPASPPVPVLAQQLAQALGRPAPRRHLPIPLLRLLLKGLPGLARWSGSHPESLDFLVRDVAFDTAPAERLAAGWGLAHPPLEQVLAATARHVRERELMR